MPNQKMTSEDSVPCTEAPGYTLGQHYARGTMWDGVRLITGLIEIEPGMGAVSYPIPVNQGGTGATTPAQACVNLGVPAAYVPPSTYPKDYGTYRQVDTNCTGVVSFVLNGRMYDFPVTDKGAAPV